MLLIQRIIPTVLSLSVSLKLHKLRYEEDNIKIIKDIMEQPVISVYESCIIRKLYNKKDIHEYTDVDFADLRKFWNLKRIIVDVIGLLHTDKQVNIVQNVLNKGKLNDHESHIVAGIYSYGKIHAKDLSFDFYNLTNYYYYYLDELLTDCFRLLDVEKQLNIIKSWCEHKVLSLNSLDLIDRAYNGDTKLVLINDMNRESLTERHLLKHPGSIVQYINLPLILQELTHKLIKYSSDELSKEYVTFFHGQSWSWNLRSLLTKKLRKHQMIDNDEHITGFTFLRYSSQLTLCTDTQHRIAQTGVRVGQFFKEDRYNVLFTNLALFANPTGSNTVEYVQNNYDQSSVHGRSVKSLVNIFKEYGFGDELSLLLSDEPDILIKLSNLHNSASKYGNIVTISIPKNIVSDIAYPSKTGGRKIKYVDMDNIVDIVDNFDCIPYANEYCIALGPNILVPKQACIAGIKVKSWNTADPDIILDCHNLIDEIVIKLERYCN